MRFVVGNSSSHVRRHSSTLFMSIDLVRHRDRLPLQRWCASYELRSSRLNSQPQLRKQVSLLSWRGHRCCQHFLEYHQ